MVEGLNKSQSLILFWFATSKNIFGANHSTDLQKLLSSDNILQYMYLGYIKLFHYVYGERNYDGANSFSVVKGVYLQNPGMHSKHVILN